jgi:hypothetical protein
MGPEKDPNKQRLKNHNCAERQEGSTLLIINRQSFRDSSLQSYLAFLEMILGYTRRPVLAL